MDHIREDLRQTRDDLNDTVFGAEQSAQRGASQAKEETKRWWNNKTEQADRDLSKAKAEIDKAVDDSKGWWSARTRDVESKVGHLEKDVRTGLNKAGDRLQEMDRNATESDADFWFRTEQNRQQQERRESGRAM